MRRTHRSGALYRESRPRVLSPAELAELRQIAACRSCSAVPQDGPKGVRIAHRDGCGGVIDRVDAG